MTQEITVVPVDARTADWPRKVATVLNRLQNTTALAGGTAAWGSITGTLSDQTDLQGALNAKQATLVSGTNIKTINSTSLLGAGDIVIGGVTSVAATVPTGFAIAGSPITSTGTLAISYSAGYSLPTDANQANWTTAFGWGDHAAAGYLTTAAAAAAYQPLDTQLTSLAGLSYTGNSLKVVRVNAGETAFELATVSGGSLADGDYGDITVSSSGTVMNIDAGVVGPTELANTAVTPGSYTKASITVDQQGRLTAASTGAFRGALVKKAADETAANYTTATAIAWDAETYDTDTLHDTVTNNSRLTVPSGVSYVRLSAGVNVSNITADVYTSLQIRKAGAVAYDGQGSVTIQANLTNARINAATAVVPVSAGDYFEVFLQIQTDTSVTIVAAQSWFAMEVIA